MRVALLTTGIFPFVIGGVQRHSYYLSKYLARAGVHVDLYHTTFDGHRPDISEFYSDAERQFINEIYVPFPAFDRFPGKYLRASFRYSQRLFEELQKRDKVDLIYSKGLAARKMLKEKNRLGLPPICVNVHGYEYFQRAASIKTRLEQLMLRPAFRYVNEHADYIFSYGAPISAIIRKHIRCTEGRIIEIPAGIERDQVGEHPLTVNPEREFVFIGRYERRKGIEELLNVAENLDRSFRFKLHIIGPIPAEKQINSRRIRFHGEIKDKARINNILQNADVLLCPSYSEGMPNVILEGMAAGCAIIASAVGAIPIQVNSSNGWLIEPGSKKSLKESMNEALTIDDEQLISMKQASRKTVMRDFLWDDIVRRTIESFNFILQQKATSA